MGAIQDMPEFSWGVFTWQMIIICSIIFMVYCLRHISKHKFNNNNKIYWVLVVIFLPVVGSILYLFFGKKNHKE